MRVVTAEQMREIDRITIEERGVPSLTLMERAGTAVADFVMARHTPRSVAICAGKGNNAGDGFVVARLLAQRGVGVNLFLACPSDELSGDAAINYSTMPARVRHHHDPEGEHLRELGGGADLVVDAVLGTGIQGVVRGSVGRMIETINALGKPIVAIDTPSGLDAENLREDGPCVRAGATVTMGLPKLPMVIFPGVQYVGELIVADIGFPSDLLEADEIRVRIVDHQDFRDRLPERASDSHKGSYGHLLIVAGALGMGGAAAMAGQAAVRSGVGLVTVATHEKCIPALEAHLLSAVKMPLRAKKTHVLDETVFKRIERDLDRFQAVALGPGMGEDPATRKLILMLIERIEGTLILDADGLNALATDISILGKRPGPTILTPHPKELSRLSGQTVGEVQMDRMASAQSFAQEHGVTLVLKGVRTVIADASGGIWINTTGNHGLAKGGSGDILTGLIGGLVAQGLSPLDAAICGVMWHGASADAVAEHLDPRVMVPDDVIAGLGDGLRKLVD